MSIRRSLRLRKKVDYNFDSNDSILSTEDNSEDTYKTDNESDSDSDSGLFVKKKPKLSRANVSDNLLEVLQTIDQNDDENEYKLQRRKNMQDRFKVLDSLEVGNELEELKSVTIAQKPVKPKKVIKPSPAVPTKRSLRLRNRSMTKSSSDISVVEPEPQFGTLRTGEDDDDKPRITDENVPFMESGAEEDLFEVLKTLKEDINLPFEKTSNFCTSDFDKYVEIVGSCRMRGELLKVTKQRIVSMDFHPSSKKLIIIAGDKHGNIGLQDIVNEKTGFEFHAHAYNVNCVSFSNQDHSKFFSTSLEGVVRQGDMNSSQSQLIYTAEPGEHTTWHHEFGHSLLVAEGEGTTKLVDLRTPNYENVSFRCHKRSVRTVQLHPTDENYFLTGSGSAEFAIFDIRNCSPKKPTPVVLQTFDKALTSAFFSAKGNYVLSTCNDDTIRVFQIQNLQSSDQITKITHNNHTGRWLSVFKAKWHPEREDAFFVGSMMNPKRIQLYQRNGKIIHNFLSSAMITYSPVVVAHPSQPVFVGGNGSGKIHIFAPFSLEEFYS